MFQHIFWFFGHPEVYILILPAFGMISAIIPTFARKPLFGYTSMVFATGSIAFLSFIVWAHHMYTVGMPLSGELFFMYATMLIAIPTGVKIFNWLATMWRGSMTFETPMLYAISAVALFTVGGLTGVMMAITPVDFQYHDTYFIVAHFHYTIFSGSVLSMFAGVYYWLPKWTGHMYNETLGKWHFWLTVIGFNVTFFPQHFLGLAGMPRRIPDYAQQFTEFNMVSSIGAFVMGFAQLILMVVVVKAIRGGKKASGEVWENPEGLEWTLPSPAPYHTFETPPQVR
jgi:cytochrome c oxidase subunit 1